MRRVERSREVVGRLLGAGVLSLVLAGCWNGSPGAPTAPTPPKVGQASAPPPPPASRVAPAREEDEVALALRQTPLAPSFHALALGLEVDGTTKVDVSLEGEATLFEVDLADGPIALRRARALGPSDAPGLFGRGWRSEVESCVLPAGDGALVVRVQGATPFVPLEGDVLVSLAGEVELLRRTPSGWELAAADGRVFAFDARGQLASIAPGFAVERAPGQLVLTDAAGARVVLALDDAGRVARVDAPGEAFDLRHDPATGELLAAGDRRYEVDARGRLVRASGLSVEIAHDADGRVARLTRADGLTQRYAFGAGSAEVSTPEGRFAYRQVDDGLVVDTPRGEDRAWLDARGRLVAFRRAGEATQTFARDDLEQPALLGPPPAAPGDEVARALGLTVTRDEAGRLSEVLTPAGRRWTFGWEERRLVSTDGPAGPTTLTRDGRGRLTSRRDASDRELAYELDAHGRPVSVAARTGEQVVWTRDEDGVVQAIESHDAAGTRARIAFERDEAAGVVGVALPGGTALRYEETTDQDRVVTPWGAFVTTYDATGRPAALMTPVGEFRFAHDAHGRRTETEYPSGLVVERTRDHAGRVARQVARRGERTVSALDATWDERGDRVSATRDGVVTRYAHDAQGRLARLEREGRVATWGWNDDADRVTEGRGERTRDARFDERGRLASREGGGRAERFVHDGAGRLVERVVEADGRVVARDRFDYDGVGRLTRAARAGRPIVDYTYDPLGRVLTRTVAGKTTRFVHDGERLLAEVGPGPRVRVYVWGPADDEPLAWCERDGDDAPWRVRFVVVSDLHTSLVHTDEHGHVVAEDDLDPWGAGRAATDRPVFFAGHLVDAVAGLVPMRARWYDPSLGRFLTPDPAGLAAGPNAYVYVSGRPLDLVDPLGLQEAPRQGLAARFGRWVSDKAAATKDTVVGTVEGLGYLTGLHGTEQESAAARAASWDDVASGRAESRAYGAVDGYVQGLTWGLVDPNMSRLAHDPDQARRGRAYGDAGALAFGVVSGAGAVRMGGAAVVAGARALPGAVRALPGAVRALPGVARALPGALANGARAVPGLARDGLGWLARNRGALARGVGRAVAEQAQGAYRVTVGPFVNLARALLRPVKALRGARAPRALPRPLSSGGAASLADDVARAGAGADDVAHAGAGADDVARAAADDVAGPAAAPRPAVAQDGLVQALGGPPPTGAPRAAPAPRAPVVDTPADEVARAAADDVVSQPAVTQPAPARDLAQVVDDAPAGVTPEAPRPGQGATQTPRAPPRVHGPARVEAVLEGEHAIAYELARGRQVASGSLTAEEHLSLHVNVVKAGLPKGQGYGREAIVSIHDAFAANGQPPRGIDGLWLAVEDLDENLKAYIKARSLGMTKVEAALDTPTGRAAQFLRFGTVQTGSLIEDVNEAGEIVAVTVTFVP
jgi:RHS repeat-associated protein